VYGELAGIVEQRTTAEWLELCERIGVPASVVPTLDEIVDDPELHRGALVDDEHPVVGPYRQIAPPVVFSRSPASVRRTAPLLAENTVEVLAEAGYTEAEIDALVATGAARARNHDA
jgi:formyl-CoA transferase